jgi:hypothetical protein
MSGSQSSSPAPSPELRVERRPRDHRVAHHDDRRWRVRDRQPLRRQQLLVQALLLAVRQEVEGVARVLSVEQLRPERAADAAAPLGEIGERARIGRVAVPEVLHRHLDLAKGVPGRQARHGLAGRLHRGKQEADQHPDDRDDDEQLDEREASGRSANPAAAESRARALVAKGRESLGSCRSSDHGQLLGCSIEPTARRTRGRGAGQCR